MSNLEKMGVQVFGMSVQSVESHKRFADKEKLNFPILADVGGKVAKKYGVLKMTRVADRVTFLIDKEGVIKAIDRAVQVKTHGSDVAKALAKILEEGKAK
jgi:peroxiredoxin Q/BCP